LRCSTKLEAELEGTKPNKEIAPVCRASVARAQNRLILGSRGQRAHTHQTRPTKKPASYFQCPPPSSTHLSLLYLKSTTSHYIHQFWSSFNSTTPNIQHKASLSPRCRSYLSWASTSSTTQPSSVIHTSSKSPLSALSLCRKVYSYDLMYKLLRMLIYAIRPRMEVDLRRICYLVRVSLSPVRNAR